ncbi:MAG: amidophosphoribosyltransferase [Candidatus Aminicenantes bacterium]|nr:amidophosphoribosyltransferase [Candidatus Aminicenantes bacterium]
MISHMKCLDDGGLRHQCGIFGIYNHNEPARLTYLGLYALQHRGQESAGIVTSNGRRLHLERGMGQVADVFSPVNLARLKGKSAIGHVRYSTAGDSGSINIQPILIDSYWGQIALAHNGNLVNALSLRSELVRQGAAFITTSDTEVILHLLVKSSRKTFHDALVEALLKIKGAFSLLLMTVDEMIAIRDPYGFRPLVLGKLRNSNVIASETCALDLIGAKFIREIQPGEILIINKDGLQSIFPFPERKHAQCIFELIYFARPDSIVFGESVNLYRSCLGRQLARESHVDADIVVPVPDSGVSAALGYASESKIPFDFGLIRNHYVGRTFIEPKQAIRDLGVKVKLNPVRGLIRGKRVVLVDDSIVRATTSRKIVAMIRRAGAKEVHLRISSPPIISPCFYGIDTPTKEELIASSHSVDDIRQFIRADSLKYLSLEGILSCVKNGEKRFCTACFTEKYPIDFPYERFPQLQLFEKPK